MFAANGTTVGREILVNTATAAVRNPQITALSNGGFVVTWQDDSLGVGGDRGHHQHCREGAGVRGPSRRGAVGPELLVNTATRAIRAIRRSRRCRTAASW